MSRATTTPRGAERHGRAMMTEHEHDPYRLDAKPPEPSHCPHCGAVFEQGRWQWKEPLASTAPAVACAACRRERAHDPAGILTIEGEFLRQHHDEVVHLLQRRADQARHEHPLHRLMAIETTPAGLKATTTTVRLARGLGAALRRAYGGSLETRPAPGQDLLRIRWVR